MTRCLEMPPVKITYKNYGLATPQSAMQCKENQNWEKGEEEEGEESEHEQYSALKSMDCNWECSAHNWPVLSFPPCNDHMR